MKTLKNTRKIIQITSTAIDGVEGGGAYGTTSIYQVAKLFALCDDGTVWKVNPINDDWQQIHTHRVERG